MINNRTRTAWPWRRRGFSLVEVVISTMLVGLVLVTALKCTGSLIMARSNNADRVIANHLAQQLISEICGQPYQDESDSSGFGPEEPTSNRSQFDDVDDYHLWSASPPQDRSGNPLIGRNQWQRSVVIEQVDPKRPDDTTNRDRGLNRIIVTVSKSGQTLAVQFAFRGEETLP